MKRILILFWKKSKQINLIMLPNQKPSPRVLVCFTLVPLQELVQISLKYLLICKYILMKSASHKYCVVSYHS